MDQKIQKDWAKVMQQFDLPVENTNTREKKLGFNTCTPPIKREPAFYKSKGFRAGAIFAGTALFAGISLYSVDHSKINYSFTALNKLLDTTTASSNDLSSAQAQYIQPRYLTLTKSLDLSSLATLSAKETSIDFDRLESQNWKTHVVSSKDNLSKIFYKLGIKKSDVEVLNENPKISNELNKISSGYILRAEKKNGKLSQLITYKANAKKSFIITRKDKGYTGVFRPKLIETRQTRTTLFINHSLRFDANQENIPHEIIQKITKIFDRDVKLTRDLKKGDRITLVYEQIFHRGNKIADGDILAAELIHNNRSHRAIRFALADKKIDYFDTKGFDLSNAFKRYPMATHRRVSSRFGRRSHPIYKRIRMHTGVDYAAPKGSPVTVTGNGVVQHVARKGGYGNTVIIKHSNGITTLYGHLSGYKKNLKPGQKVYLGDVIGYVGSTGASTGYHLHYEVRVNGIPKNPSTIELPKALSLTFSERKKFKESSHNLIRQLDVLQRFAEEKVDIKSGFGG